MLSPHKRVFTHAHSCRTLRMVTTSTPAKRPEVHVYNGVADNHSGAVLTHFFATRRMPTRGDRIATAAYYTETTCNNCGATTRSEVSELASLLKEVSSKLQALGPRGQESLLEHAYLQRLQTGLLLLDTLQYCSGTKRIQTDESAPARYSPLEPKEVKGIVASVIQAGLQGYNGKRLESPQYSSVTALGSGRNAQKRKKFNKGRLEFAQTVAGYVRTLTGIPSSAYYDDDWRLIVGFEPERLGEGPDGAGEELEDEDEEYEEGEDDGSNTTYYDDDSDGDYYDDSDDE